MTVIVYQDAKLYTDTTAFTDYSDAVSQVKWGMQAQYQLTCAFAGSQEDISLAIKPALFQGHKPTELAIVSLKGDGSIDTCQLSYGENGGLLYPVIPLDDTPVLFGNNALRAIVKNYMETVYTWDEPLMVAMVKAGVFPAVVELSPMDGHHYLHKFSGSEILPHALNLYN